MRRYALLIMLCLTMGLSQVYSSSLSALEAADNSIRPTTEVISRGCVQAQNNLRQLYEADKVTRINRGYTYTNLSSLMSAMSARAALNMYTVPQLSSSNRTFTQLHDSFNETYRVYAIDIDNVIRMDCRSEPDHFYDLLQSIRAQRALLATTIDDINSELDGFSAGLAVLKKQMDARQ